MVSGSGQEGGAWKGKGHGWEAMGLKALVLSGFSFLTCCMTGALDSAKGSTSSDLLQSTPEGLKVDGTRCASQGILAPKQLCSWGLEMSLLTELASAAFAEPLLHAGLMLGAGDMVGTQPWSHPWDVQYRSTWKARSVGSLSADPI